MVGAGPKKKLEHRWSTGAKEARSHFAPQRALNLLERKALVFGETQLC